MKQIISESDFRDAFERMGRHNNFSYAGLGALFDYLEEYEEETGEQIEFDPIALCCEYTEYENIEELKKDYDNIEDMDDLENSTEVIHIEGTDGFIIQQF